MLGNDRFPFFLWMGNSLKLAILTTVLGLIFTAMAAYAFSRFRFRGRRSLLQSILLVQVFPNFLNMVALFLILQQLGAYIPFLNINTHGGLLLIYLGGILGVNTWLAKGYFDSIPRDLDEAAMMDGAWALPTATLLRASVARQLRYDEDYRSGEDTELLFRFHAAGHRLVVNRAVIGAWRRHALPGTDPQKTGAADSMSLEHELLLEMYRHPEPRSRDVRRRIARMHAKRMIRDRRWREARPYLWQWWRLRPGSTRALRLLVRSYVAGKARRPSWPAIRASAGSG